jgi:hypothetical protein
LLFNVLAAGLFILLPKRLYENSRTATASSQHPFLIVAPLTLLCCVVYLPMLAHFGFAAWAAFFTKPLYFQVCRLALYLTWFLAGAWVGAIDLDRGVLSRAGSLAINWRWWLAACLVAYNLLVFVPRHGDSFGLSVYEMGAVEAVLWVISCVASCFGFLALFRGVVRTRRKWMDSLTRSAYTIYIVHYMFVVWIQFTLLDYRIPASLKFAVTFSLSVLLSWTTALVLLRIPGLRRVL